MSNIVKRDPAIDAGSLGAKSIFEVQPGIALAQNLYVPDTHYILVYNKTDRQYQVQDTCGFIHYDLTRRVRAIIIDNVYIDYHTAGRMLQRHAKQWAS